MPEDTLTLLAPADGSIPGKVVTQQGPQTPPPALLWRAATIPLDGPDKLFRTLERAAQSRQVIAVRGTPRPDANRSAMRRAHVNEPTLDATSHHWLLVDLDKHRPTEDMSGPVELCALQAREDLGWSDAACWYQATSSARVKPGLRLRLAFWLDRPLSDQEVKAWAKTWPVKADLSLYTPSQPHFLGAPLYQGAPDPYEGEARSGTLSGGALRAVIDPTQTLQAEQDLQSSVRAVRRAQDGERRNALNTQAFRLASRYPEDELPAQRITEALEGALPPENLGYKASLTLRQAIDDGRAKLARDRDGWRALLARDPEGAPRSTAANVSLYLEHHPAFAGKLAYDERSNRQVWLSPPPWPDRGPNADVAHAIEWFQTQAKIDAKTQWVTSGLIKAALAKPFDPLQDYLEALPEHDGKARAETLLIRHLGVEDTPLHRAQTKAWLVQAYRRAFATLDSPVKADYLLVLVGAQGLGKSSFARELCPLPRFFRDHLPSLTDKDASLAVLGSWIIELSELTQRKADQDAFKAFSSRLVETFRPPYGHTEIQAARRCVLLATTNTDNPLTDPTGNRRFWPMRVNNKANPALVAAERDQLWAEVRDLALAGEKAYLDDKFEALAAINQEEFREEDPIELRLAQALSEPVEGFCRVRKLTQDRLPLELTSIQAADLVGHGKNPRDLVAVKACLRKLGWHEHRRDARFWRRPKEEDTDHDQAGSIRQGVQALA